MEETTPPSSLPLPQNEQKTTKQTSKAKTPYLILNEVLLTRRGSLKTLSVPLSRPGHVFPHRGFCVVVVIVVCLSVCLFVNQCLGQAAKSITKFYHRYSDKKDCEYYF